MLGVVYGDQPSDQGLHRLAVIMGVAATVLLVATLFDRTLPRTIAASVTPT